MTDHATLPVTAEELLVVLSDLWSVVFGSTVIERGVEPDPGNRWWASARILGAGDTVADVVLLAEDAWVRSVARATFRTDDPAEHLLADVLVEVANIIAGNLKGILELDTPLPVPRAGRGAPPLDPDRPAVWVRGGDDRGRRVTVAFIHHAHRSTGAAAQENSPC